MIQRVLISLHEDVRVKGLQLAEKKYITFSGLVTQLILAESESILKDIQVNAPKPIGRPRHTAQDKEITRLIGRAERFPIEFRKELAEVEGLYDAMFGEIQARLNKAIEERDGPTLEGLAQGQEWQEARDLYWEKEEGNVNS